MKRPWSRAALIAAVVTCFSLAAAYNAYFHPFVFPDEADYWTLASNLVQSGTLSLDGVNPSAYRPPLVAWVLAPFVAMGWSTEMVRPVFVIFYLGSGCLAGYFLCRVFPASRWTPPLGVAFVLSHPIYFFSAGNLYPQQILTPLLLSALLLACGKLTAWRSAAIGLISALSLLASAPAIFSLLPIFVLLAWKDLTALRAGSFLNADHAIITCLTALLCITPYVLRNARQVHPGIYLSLNSGINLLLGNSPGTTATSGIAVDLSEELRGHENASEFELNRHLTAAAVRNIRQDPGYYARLYLRKLCAGFGNSVATATHGYNQAATWLMWAYMIVIWTGVGLPLVRLLRFSPEWKLLKVSTFLILAAYLLTIAGYAIFFTRLRFRMPVDVALVLLSAAGWGGGRSGNRVEIAETGSRNLS